MGLYQRLRIWHPVHDLVQINDPVHEGSPAEIRQFFQEVKNGDHKSINTMELIIWDFIDSYLLWLESPTDNESLNRKYREYRQESRDIFGSMAQTKHETYLGFEISRMEERLKGNEGQSVHFELLKAVEESFKFGQMPPKFKGKELRKALPSESIKPKELEKALPSESIKPKELEEFFKGVKDNEVEMCTKEEKKIIDIILYYLKWLDSPWDDAFLYSKYEAYKKGKNGTCMGPLSVSMYEIYLRWEIRDVKDRLEAGGGEPCHLELLKTIGEFLKGGKIPPDAHKYRSQKEQSPPKCDANTEAFRVLPTTEVMTAGEAGTCDTNSEDFVVLPTTELKTAVKAVLGQDFDASADYSVAQLGSIIKGKLDDLIPKAKVIQEQLEVLLDAHAKIEILEQKRT